ncbi:MAG: hypothetical protein AB1540_14165 [Bdellovibrionota bacterium]
MNLLNTFILGTCLTLQFIVSVPARAETSLINSSFSIQVPKSEPGTEYILNIDYKVDCEIAIKNKPHTITGSVGLPGRSLRFDLFDSKNTTEVLLGRFTEPSSLKITIDADAMAQTAGCRLAIFEPKVTPALVLPKNKEGSRAGMISRLALAHSPFLVVRPDQHSNRFTDIPLEVVYHVEFLDQDQIRLIYTVFFSDEDSKTSTADTEGQMARYGRRTDIEWIYSVNVRLDGSVVQGSASFQGGEFVTGLTQGGIDIGHSKNYFSNKMLEGTDHPILFNAALNNTFKDEPADASRVQSDLVGHHLVPRIKVSCPDAREIVMFNNPWMFKVSDYELASEGKLSQESSEYLFASIQGRLNNTKFLTGVTGKMLFSDDQRAVFSGDGKGFIDRLGEDMWQSKSYTAIPVGKEELQELKAMRVNASFQWETQAVGLDLIASWASVEMKTSPTFFSLVDVAEGRTFRVDPITPRECKMNSEGQFESCSWIPF